MPQETSEISTSDVALLVANLGYEVEEKDGILVITTDTGMKIVGVLQGEVVVFTVNLIKVAGGIDQFIAKNPATVSNMLTGSHDVNAKFILSESNGQVSINLMEKVKLLACEEDDQDDIAYALSSIEQDAMIDCRQALDALL